MRKKASKFGEKAIKEASTPGKKLKGWSKIAAPGVPFHVKKIIEGKNRRKHGKKRTFLQRSQPKAVRQ